mmetsp:Transcript_9372/g.13762  ORF Transcript_9372/g.13762 Transcript_9372/m.13762 type:complete len:118 (-) Transcript_9372:272-625(-)
MDAMQVQNEIISDKTFLDSCPFDTIIRDKDVFISVEKNAVSPMDVVEILLQTIQNEATAYFEREREVAVGMSIHTHTESDGTTATGAGPTTEAGDEHCIQKQVRHCNNPRCVLLGVL